MVPPRPTAAAAATAAAHSTLASLYAELSSADSPAAATARPNVLMPREELDAEAEEDSHRGETMRDELDVEAEGVAGATEGGGEVAAEVAGGIVGGVAGDDVGGDVKGAADEAKSAPFTEKEHDELFTEDLHTFVPFATPRGKLMGLILQHES